MNSTLYLSYFINEETPVYGGAKGVIKISKERSISEGDNSNNLSLNFPAHVGTHIDFPFHFSNEGKKSHQYPASFWIFNKIGFVECSVCDILNHLDNLPPNIEMLILKTGFGVNRYNAKYWSSQPIIPSSLANILKNKFLKLRVFGFDLISLTSKLDRVEGKNAHMEFLIKNDILVLEDMNLEKLTFTPNKIIIAPLQIHSADGVPCNVIAY